VATPVPSATTLPASAAPAPSGTVAVPATPSPSPAALVASATPAAEPAIAAPAIPAAGIPAVTFGFNQNPGVAEILLFLNNLFFSLLHPNGGA
jgi:hypothetical protein